MKGIILAGGSGTRLYPITLGVSKQLLPVYDKPMIYYPLSVLMLAGIREILVISTPIDLPLSAAAGRRLAPGGYRSPTRNSRGPRDWPRHSSSAGNSSARTTVCLILGDNIFYGPGLPAILREAVQLTRGGLIFGYPVRDPERYGVVEFDAQRRVIGIEEKPAQAEIELRRAGALLLRQRRGRHRRKAQTLRPRRDRRSPT